MPGESAAIRNHPVHQLLADHHEKQLAMNLSGRESGVLEAECGAVEAASMSDNSAIRIHFSLNDAFRHFAS